MGEYVRETWYVAFWSADIAPGALYARTLLDTPLVFFRTATGDVAALDDTCPHRFAPLSKGSIAGDGTIECGYHGLRFNGAGACVHNPHGNHNIPEAARVRSYPVIERHSIAWIWMGSGAAKPDAIPDYGIFDAADPVHVSKRDRMVIHAGYHLITDNLLDLSHVPFLHAGVLSGSVDDEIDVRQDGNTVTISRWSYDVAAPTLFDALFRADGKNVDTWTEMHWMPPGCMILDTGIREPGTAKERGAGFFGIHLLTPETSVSTHYHFTAVRFSIVPRSRAEDERLRETLSVVRRYAFAEQDAPMIEAQQARILAHGHHRPALLSVDAGAVRVQRILANLRAAEDSDGAASYRS
jgi:phenylpropionate dioxygenase-like ring-hydroxylating dioxygenase large terminal subunit